MTGSDPTDASPRATAELRVAFWNTWLLRPRMWPRGPRWSNRFGWFAPEVDRRATLVAEAVASRFDVAALSEVFDRSDQAAVAAAWPEATFVAGPQRRRTKATSSGLATFVAPTVRLLRSAHHGYRSGGDLRDSDTFATKGALFTQVEVHRDLPPVEIVSTHLFAGGDLFPVPGADDVDRHHRVRMAQVDELVEFVQREHHADSPLLVVGDLNVQAHDQDPNLDHPAARYRDLAERLAPLGVIDVWAHHGVGPGASCTFDHVEQLPADPHEPDQVADDPDADHATSPGERIDYLWLSVPAGLTVQVERPRRWAFTGRGVEGGPAGSLSDHLAKSVTLRLSS